MFAARLICSWIGALGLAAEAFCQTQCSGSLPMVSEQVYTA
jgi:hypothetical protein